MKSPMELNSLFSKIFCYITWLDVTVDDLQTRSLRPIVSSKQYLNGLKITNWHSQHSLYTLYTLFLLSLSKFPCILHGMVKSLHSRINVFRSLLIGWTRKTRNIQILKMNFEWHCKSKPIDIMRYPPSLNCKVTDLNLN